MLGLGHMKGLQDVEKAAQGELLWLPETERKIVWAWALRIPMSYLARDHAAARVHVSYLARGHAAARVHVSYLARDHAAARVHAGSWRAARRRSMASQICASRQTPSKRLISWMPVGEVTLISVR